MHSFLTLDPTYETKYKIKQEFLISANILLSKILRIPPDSHIRDYLPNNSELRSIKKMLIMCCYLSCRQHTLLQSISNRTKTNASFLNVQICK